MGLDMYLEKETYLGFNYEHNREKFSNLPDLSQFGIDVNRVSTINEHIAYWRKANQIHKWFVDNVQGGNDDCGRYYVYREKLQELYDLCKRLLKEGGPKLWEKELPTQGGFFFGDTQYGEYYKQDLIDTVDQLGKALKEEGGDFYYSSSW